MVIRIFTKWDMTYRSTHLSFLSFIYRWDEMNSKENDVENNLSFIMHLNRKPVSIIEFNHKFVSICLRQCKFIINFWSGKQFFPFRKKNSTSPSFFLRIFFTIYSLFLKMLKIWWLTKKLSNSLYWITIKIEKTFENKKIYRI